MPKCRPWEPNTGRPDFLISALLRKSRQVINDPVLRQWLIGRMLGRNPKPAAFEAHLPPYLPALQRHDAAPVSPLEANPTKSFPAANLDPIKLPLAGTDVLVEPKNVGDLFQQQFADTETLLSLHRFAWVPLLGDIVDPAWVDLMWTAWTEAHGTPNGGWAWHPYTAAERAINILGHAEAHGYPGERRQTAALLRRHAEVIADGLEYWGEHNTSNHLANNGRGLYRIGLAFDLDWAIEMGRDILLNEAKRLFLPSGVLREGSSHYHLLYTQRYVDAWLAASAAARPETGAFRDIAQKALGVLPHLNLPGGFPVIGDISPDSPPSHLTGLISGPPVKWMASLSDGDLNLISDLRKTVTPSAAGTLLDDGWVRHDHGPWSALWYVSPEGWPPMPGHAHQDCGSFELHFGTTRVIVDPGRGAYGNSPEAAHGYSAEAHNLVTVDDAAPYPDNRPYFDDAFRARVGGQPPKVEMNVDGVTIRFEGFSRLKSVGTITRQWQFDESCVVISDHVAGTRPAKLTRHLHVSGPVSVEGDAVFVDAPAQRFRITSKNSAPRVAPAKIWRQYGESDPGSRISFVERAGLPWSGTITIEAI